MVYATKCYGKGSRTMIRVFVETKVFYQLLELADDLDLERIIKNEILKNPECGDVVSGAGGTRKMRVGNQFRGKGKSGGYRVLFLDLPQVEKTFLIFLYDKDELENLSQNQKSILKKLAEEIKHEKHN